MIEDVEKIQREVLTDQVYLKVGKIHSMILLADNSLEELQYEPIDQTVEFDFRCPKLTPFGDATIGDFTGYFLKNNIEIIIDLKENLENLHPHLDALKRDSKKVVESYEVEEYTDLLEIIKKFYQEHIDNIDTLYDTIKFFQGKDKIAPAIFFTYPQWSQSQISDRHLKIKSEKDANENIIKAGDIVSGLYGRFGPTYYTIRTELESSLADSVDPERNQNVSVSEKTVIIRTSRKALLELATYFEKIRVCCEHILSQIQNLCDGTILENTQFLELFVQKAMDKTLTETTLWDFKQTFPVWNYPNGRNKEKFALKVASYANNRGGILIAGISDDRKMLGITESEERKKLTRALIDDKIENSDHGVEVVTIPLKNENGEKVSCLLILIPQNSEVTSVTKLDGSVVYPFRDGVETKYKSLAEMTSIKGKITDNNFRFARDLVNFVFRNGIVG